MGDFNNKDIEEAIGDYEDIDVVRVGPTRGDSFLDVTATSFRNEIVSSTTHSPLESDEALSDHHLVVHSAELKHTHCFEWKRFSYRRVTKEGEDELDRCMKNTPWQEILPRDPEDRIACLHQNIIALKDRCFPLAHVKIRSTDDPWVDEAVRKKIAQQQDVYKLAGCKRTEDWKKLKKESDGIIATRKKRYYKEECDKLAQEGSHKISSKALRNISDAERTSTWCIKSLWPDKSDDDIAERLADFFASISQTFAPLDKDAVGRSYDR